MKSKNLKQKVKAFKNKKSQTRGIFNFDQPVANTDPALPATTNLGNMLTAWVEQLLNPITIGTPKYEIVLKLKKNLKTFSKYIPDIIQSYNNYYTLV